MNPGEVIVKVKVIPDTQAFDDAIDRLPDELLDRLAEKVAARLVVKARKEVQA